MRIHLLIFLVMSFSLFAQDLSDEVDYSSFSKELTFLEEAAQKADQKLLDNVDKISEEKVERPAHTYADEHTDLVSTSTSAVEKSAPVFQAPVEKRRRVRSR